MSKSLGIHVYSWCREWLRQPDGPDAGGPWIFTREQTRFIDAWYSIDDQGRWLYNRGVLRRMKGWGKSPFVAALALAELCGPVRFDGWDDEGEPMARPVSAAWVQLAGVSEKQTLNTMSMVLAMVSESPVVEHYGLDTGLTRIYTAAGGRLEPITASAATAEGARPTFVVQDETHHWTDSNNGTDLDRVNRRNLGKSRDGSARMLETTNAHATGMQSVAEKSYEAHLANEAARADGKSAGSKLLYDARQADPSLDIHDPDQRREAVIEARGDSVWLDLERIEDEYHDASTPVEDFRRFYLNQIVNAVDSWFTGPEWASAARVDRVVEDGCPIVLGFDGSQKRVRGTTDATSLQGMTLDGHAFDVATFEQPVGAAGVDWSVPIEQVESAVEWAFRRWTVVGFFADPEKWDEHVATWEAKYGKQLIAKASAEHPIRWRMNEQNKVIGALARYHEGMLTGELTHDGSHVLTTHALNARRRATPRGFSVSKEHPDSVNKIDAVIASVLANEARLAAIARGAGTRDDAWVPRRIR